MNKYSAARSRRVFLGIFLLLEMICTSANAADVRQVTPEALSAIVAGPLVTPPSGTSRANVTLIEYFDYNCPVCRRLEPELKKLVTTDSRVRLIRKDWPVFGAASVYAAYCSFAAARLGKYTAAHEALIGTTRDLDSKEDVQAVLREAGFDVPALDADIAAHQKEYSAVLTRNLEEAQSLGLRGTPGLIVGDLLIPGGVSYAQLVQLVGEVRRPK